MHRIEPERGRRPRWRGAPLVAAALALVALAVPAAASAHPQVYSLTPKALPASPAVCTYESDSTGACLIPGKVRYAVANDGFAMTYTENGEAASGGVVNYQMMPGGFRKWTGGEMSGEQKRTFPLAQTEVQAHATCSGVAALESGPNILAWQGADPFFNYIPWQKTTGGLGDVPSKWIPVVLEKTGVDLSALSTEAEFKTACEGKGGSYHKADSPTVPDANAIAEAVEPLQLQVTSLLASEGTLKAQIDAWKAKTSALEGEKAGLVAEKAALEQQLAGFKQANAKKAATIKTLRKQLKAARRHG